MFCQVNLQFSFTFFKYLNQTTKICVDSGPQRHTVATDLCFPLCKFLLLCFSQGSCFSAEKKYQIWSLCLCYFHWMRNNLSGIFLPSSCKSALRFSSISSKRLNSGSTVWLTHSFASHSSICCLCSGLNFFRFYSKLYNISSARRYKSVRGCRRLCANTLWDQRPQEFSAQLLLSPNTQVSWQMHLQRWPWRRSVWTATSHTPTLTVTQSVCKCFFICHVMM